MTDHDRHAPDAAAHTGPQPTGPQRTDIPEETTMSTLRDDDLGTDRSHDDSWLAAGRHPVNVGHLVMGIAFLGLLAVWALISAGAVDGADTRWLLPVPWLAAGAAGIAATVLTARRAHRAGT
ncbi:hypothetical protein RDV89_06920 [Nocardioides zeae]|uniref:Uncharacterized protein n=1 Tax=Nocardioides imazamoxiresistens TaxID=3231893 RepID=A0ABU3PU84_9ACTN|nr:hypothetical protein [Nocardioides zeae]MDT9592792.1 hypothetical protein [Nocardioides zeae]